MSEALTQDVTDAEALEIDRAMAEHMRGHAISNSPNYFSCDPYCRRNAIRKAVQQMLDDREDPA